MPDDASRLAALAVRGRRRDLQPAARQRPGGRDLGQGGRRSRCRAPAITSIWLDTLDVPQLKSAKVRQALNYAVDVNTIIKKVMDGYALRTATIVPPYFSGYSKSIKPFPYNPRRRSNCSKQAGYPNGFSMTLMVPKGRYLLGEDIAQAVAGYLGKVGVRRRSTSSTSASSRRRRRSGRSRPPSSPAGARTSSARSTRRRSRSSAGRRASPGTATRRSTS